MDPERLVNTGIVHATVVKDKAKDKEVNTIKLNRFANLYFT